MSLEVGQKVPDRTLKATGGKEISLSDYQGKYIILYFYPKDMTPGCTTEACDFRDNHKSFKDLDAVILGVSPDPLKQHDKFISKHDLPFELIADEDHQLAEDFGVWQLKKNFGKEYMGIVRSTFIIDKEGKLIKEWRQVKVKEHVEDALSYLKEEAK